jgi:exopolysaccharide biosynthesis polyprenyl glycosylphosphotransferase
MKPKKKIQFSEQFPVYDAVEAPHDNREADASRLFAPAWARGLSWLFVKPLRLALMIGCLDVICASLAQAAAFIFCIKRLGVSGEIHDYLPLWAIYNILLILFIYLGGGYVGMKDRRPEEELSLITKGNILAIFLLIVMNFIGTKCEEASRYIFMIGFIFSLSSTLTVHFAWRELLKKLWGYRLARENLLIVGDSSKNIRWFLDHLHIQRYQGFNILGYVAETISATDLSGLQYLGRFQDLTTIHENKKINKVLFAMQRYSNDRHHLLKTRLEECAKLRIPALILSHILNDYNFDLSLDGYSGVFSISSRDPAYSRALFWFGKRCIDIFVSLLILVAVAPLWLVFSVCIKLQDGGPIFFRHRLVGKGGKMFDQLKFRTMVTNSEEILKSDPKLLERFLKDYKLDNDPRITRIGKWLRKYSLDELPQLVNVLKGDMSLVGPRPVKEEELPRFGHFQNARVKIRPGLTGYWQVNGRSTTSYEERVQMDKFYMQKCTIWMDLFILLKTPLVVARGHGAV